MLDVLPVLDGPRFDSFGLLSCLLFILTCHSSARRNNHGGFEVKYITMITI